MNTQDTTQEHDNGRMAAIGMEVNAIHKYEDHGSILIAGNLHFMPDGEDSDPKYSDPFVGFKAEGESGLLSLTLSVGGGNHKTLSDVTETEVAKWYIVFCVMRMATEDAKDEDQEQPGNVGSSIRA